MASVLHKLRPQLAQYLSYDDVKHHLLNYKLLTYNEYQRLDVLQKTTSDGDLVEKVLDLVTRKGPHHDTLFVRALDQSLRDGDSPHLGNQELLPLLQRELDLQKARRAAYPGLNAHIVNGEEVERDGIYLCSLPPVKEQGGFLNTDSSWSVGRGLEETWKGSSVPLMAESTKWPAAGSMAMQEQASHSSHSTSSPVFSRKEKWHISAGDSPIPFTTAKSPPTQFVAEVTGSLNALSLHPAEGVHRKLQARAAMALGDFSVAQEIRLTQQDPEDLKCQIVKESRAIIRKYATLVLQVYRLLQKLSAPFDEVRLALITLGCTQSQPGPGSSSLFPASGEIARAKNMPDLVMSLHAYSSWFNYDLIKFLGEQFGGQEGIELIAAYEDELRDFFKKFIYECPQFAGHTVPDGFMEMEMKVDWEYQNCRTQDVAIFKTTVTELLEIEPHTLRLKSVEEGCVLVTWMVPFTTVPHIAFRLSKEKVMEKLARERLRLVKLPGRLFEVPARLRFLANESPSTQPFRSNNFSPSPLKYFSFNRRNSVDHYDNTTFSTTPTVSSLSDMTEVSTPYHHRSGTSLSSSVVSRRALSNCFSNASVDELFADTHSVKEVEILSLYSGERSPASTIDRYSKRNSKRSSHDSSLIDSLSSSCQVQRFATSDFALSDTNLHYVACRLTSRMQGERRKSETDIAHLKDASERGKYYEKKKKKPKPYKGRFSFQRIVNFGRRRTLKKNAKPPRSQSSTAITTLTCTPQSPSATDTSQSPSVAPQSLPVLELTAEPLPAFGGKPHYYNYIGCLSHLAADKMTAEPLPEDSNNGKERGDEETSITSIVFPDNCKERVGGVSPYDCSSGYSSQEMPCSQERAFPPSVLTDDFASGNLGLFQSQPSLPPCSEEIDTYKGAPLQDRQHTHSHSDTCHVNQRNHAGAMSSNYQIHLRRPSSDDCPLVSRVISPSCSLNSYQVSSGYGSHQSSECSLSLAESLGTQISISEEQDNYYYGGRSVGTEGAQRVRGLSMRRHHSLSCRSRYAISHDTSPLVRCRSNSMHK